MDEALRSLWDGIASQRSREENVDNWAKMVDPRVAEALREAIRAEARKEALHAIEGEIYTIDGVRDVFPPERAAAEIGRFRKAVEDNPGTTLGDHVRAEPRWTISRDTPAVVDFAELLPAGTVIKADADGMFYDVTPGDNMIVGPIDRAAVPTLDARCEWFGDPVVQVRTTEIGANRAIVEFRVAPMADPIIHFAHGVWYRIEVVDGAPAIRPLPPEEE